MSTPTPDTATPTAARTTSPIVRLDWDGTATVIEVSAGVAKLGYTYRVRASSLTLTRANGEAETRTPEPGHSYAEALIRKAQGTALLERVASEAQALSKAEAMPLAEALAKAEAKVLASGSLTFPVTGRATRLQPVSLASKALAMAEALAKADSEAEPEAEPEPEAKSTRKAK